MVFSVITTYAGIAGVYPYCSEVLKPGRDQQQKGVIHSQYIWGCYYLPG